MGRKKLAECFADFGKVIYGYEETINNMKAQLYAFEAVLDNEQGIKETGASFKDIGQMNRIIGSMQKSRESIESNIKELEKVYRQLIEDAILHGL